MLVIIAAAGGALLAVAGMHFLRDRRPAEDYASRGTPPAAVEAEKGIEGVEEAPFGVARAAIVIDDMGRDINALRRILAIDIPVTISVLPYLSHSRETAVEASERGREVLLHLPMEPMNMARNNPGKGALLTTMGEDEIKGLVREDIDSIPNILGVNNHMGSRFTGDERSMRAVLEVLKEDGDLFFLDSKTISSSKAYELAREMGVKSAERSVFLDNKRDVEYIRERLTELIEVANRKGEGIAIGHPYPETIRAIEEMAPLFREKGVEVVRLSELVE